MIFFLILLNVVGRPLCAVCFFGKQVDSSPRQGTFKGIISSEPQVGEKNQKFSFTTTQGRTVFVFANRYQSFHYGDEMEITGKIEKPANIQEFDYQAYLEQRGIGGVMYYPSFRSLNKNSGSYFWQWIYGVKDWMRKPILQGLPEPHASLLLAVTLGDDWRISSSFRNALAVSGTIHIISISGLHVAIIIGAVMVSFILLGLNRYWATAATATTIIFYTLMTGYSASAVRSAIMGILLLVGYIYGRFSRLFYALLLTAFFMLAWDINFLYDVGFQLSFGAMAGLALLYPRFQKWFYGFSHVKERGVLDAVIASLAVMAVISPILFYHFGRVSLISPLANIAILPFVPATMYLGFLAEISGFFIQPLWLLLEYQIKIIMFFGSLF